MDLASEAMQYVPVLMLLGIGLGLGIIITSLASIMGPRRFHPKKNLPFECGVPSHGDTHRRFSVRFYLVAILFLLFDVEVIFFYPWAVVYKDFLKVGNFIVWEMGFFVAIVLVGYYYIRRRGALEWE